MKEIILDGQLASPPNCPGEFNIAIWDVTDPGSPVAVPGGLLNEETSARNNRSYFRTSIVLDEDREYRLAARVTELRESPVPGFLPPALVTVLGGTSYADPDPCTGTASAAAVVDPAAVPLAIRYSENADAPVSTPEAAAPAAARFLATRPNPSAGPAVVTFELPAPAGVELVVFDVVGRRVRALADERFAAGAHRMSWDGNVENGHAAATGTYFLSLRVDGSVVDTQRLVVVR